MSEGHDGDTIDDEGRTLVLVNGWKVCADLARAVGRFKPEGPDGYKAATMPDAPLRKTRDEAVADEALYRTTDRRD